ncbi:MAG: fibronectin type III domain-containing protein [Cyclobacteriaceae bacterium]|nr:fibronectin type III domain-containing protein [Cyclobacteriaceae bacterium]
MKPLAKIAILITIFSSFCPRSLAQIDPSWEFFHYKNDGTRGVGPGTSGIFTNIDIRLSDQDIGTTRTYYLVESKTFSFRKSNGVPTDSYHAMAGFNSINYTQGQLREVAWSDRFRMNYRLLFPRNYNSNPNVEGGYPLIVMVHGFGERANCWGTNCYWANGVWQPNFNNLATRTISGVTSSSGALFTISGTFSTDQLQNPLSNELVFVRTNVEAYNGIRRIVVINNNQFRLSTNLTSTSPTANIIGLTGTFTSGTIERYQAETYRIVSAASGGGGSTTTFTTSEPHQFTNGQTVTISNSSVTAYNGTRTISAIPSSTTFTVSSTNFSATTTADVTRPNNLQLLNNDHSMTHGGAVHQTAVLTTTPLGMPPNAPNMPARAFPGFVLFPQNLNGWEQGGADNAVRIIRLLMQKYNIDPNKIYVHGLSDGGSATYRLVRTAPWLFAAALPMSAVRNPENLYPIYPFINTVPLWVFQGGVDGNPTKTDTEQLIQNFRNAGMDVRYKLYPTLGHGVWNNAYAEPDFFSWMMRKNKANIHVNFGKPEVCGTSGAATVLHLAQGFLAYQWERDGQIIPGATSSTYSATLPGTYRARFSRVANPGESDWNRWSDPVIVTEVAPPKPSIQALGSTVFPTVISNDDRVVLKSSQKNEKYLWSNNGVLFTPDRTFNDVFNTSLDTLSMILRKDTQPGSYTLKTSEISGCQSLSSDPVAVTFNTPTTITLPSNFSGMAQSASSIFLSWTDNSPNESGFEIWRRRTGETVYTFVTRTAEDAVSYLDNNLVANTTYYYKIRAVSSTARSTYFPGNNDINQNVVVTTLGDGILPTPPQNVRVTFNNLTTIRLEWDAGTDNIGVRRYKINYTGSPSGAAFTTSATTTFTITGLTANNAYQITVQTEDFAGNLSPPSNLLTATTYVDGLYYEHSTGAWNSLDPFRSDSEFNDDPPINWNTAEFTGKIANFNVNPNTDPPHPVNGTLGIATQQEFYKIKFDGYITRPSGAWNNIFQFRTTSDDGSMLFLKGFNRNPSDPANFAQYRIVNNDGLHGAVTVASTDVTLDSAFHRIVVLFNEFTGDQSLTVEYRRKTGSSSYESNWTTIPNSMLRTGEYTAPGPLAAPTSLTVSGTGMTSVGLTWQYGGAPAHEFEVYRSLAVDGTFAIVARATGLSYTDNTVLPGRTYFYKLRTINPSDGAISAFSSTVNASTTEDLIAPTVPTGLTLSSKTFSNVAFSWTASTDNVGVAGYEILINNTIVDSTTVSSYMATGLEPGTLYNFTVKAFDASGNKSAASVALPVTTNSGVMYYSKPSGALSSAATWGPNTDGTGTAPNLTYNGQYYMVANRASTGLGGELIIGGSVSKIIVPAGTTLNVDNTISAKIEVQGNGIVNLNNASTAPEFLSVSPSSMVNFNAYNIIPAATYGNVNLTGTGNKNFEEGDITIMGNLTATNGIALKGAPSNASRVTVHGDITLTGTPAVVATDNALDLVLAKAGTQTLTVNGPLDLYKISTATGTTVNVNSSSAITLNVGSPNGGGLALANSSTFNLGNNHLVMKNAATINAGGQTGRLALNGSNLTLNSSSTQNSNLYLDNALNIAGMVTTTFSSTGDLVIQSPLRITDGLKIKAGEVNSGGNITLVSTQTKTAYLQELEGNGSITGAAKVERWVSIARKYRYMSSAVANMTVANWQLYMPITGNFTGTSGSLTPSMFYYIENQGGYKNYPHTGSNNSVTFERGRGYSIFNYNGNSPLTLTMTGNPYQGSIPYTLTPGSGGDTGWNLVGNPYASAIMWNNLTSDWIKSGLSPIVHVPDNTSGTLVFRTYNANNGLGTLTGGIIAPGQAFWVQAVTANPSLTIHEKAKRTNTSTFFREEEATVNSITIVLSNGSLEDEAYIIVGNEYEDTYEPGIDGMKMKNQILNLSTLSSENVKLIFNNISNSFCEKTVALSVDDVTPGNYTLSFENIENLVGVGAVTLTDHFTNTTQTLTGGDHYNFAVTSSTASYGAGRFTLTLSRPALQKNAVATVENVCGGTSATIQLTNVQQGVFYYASYLNDETPLSELQSSENGTISLAVPVSALQPGTNNLVIRTGFSGCSNELLSATPLAFTYTPMPLVSVDRPYYTLCDGAQVTLKAETNPENSLRWYKDGQLIPNQTNATWVSGPIASTTLFQVAAVINGCEGNKASTYVEINQVPMPLVEFNGDVLEIVNEIPAGTFMQWYKDNEPLDAYDRGIKPVEPGSYTVLVSKGGCSKVSESFEYLVTDTENPVHDGFNVYVYPNPATHDKLYVKIETTSTLDANIAIVDLTGRSVFDASLKGTHVNGVHKLNVSQDTAPGLYIISIRQGSAVIQRKVILKFE